MKIKTWDDVDAALAEIARRQEAIATAKARVDEERAAIKEIVEGMELYVRAHEDELQERSKSLDHGRVWLRQATRLVARSWDAVIQRLLGARELGLLRTKHEPHKEQLSELSDADLAQWGIKRKTEDVFGYEAA